MDGFDALCVPHVSSSTKGGSGAVQDGRHVPSLQARINMLQQRVRINALAVLVKFRHGLADRQILIQFLSSPLTEKCRRFLQERRHFSRRLRARGGVPCKKFPARPMTQVTRKPCSNCRSDNP
jgi:hypothetical protein